MPYWQYRKSVTLSRASGAVANYQMHILVGESSGAVGEDVDCGGFCKNDFSDLKFTAADGVTVLSHWIETISGTTPNQLATVWVEFDSIGTGATTFYMYYGNAGAVDPANIKTTFPVGDEFDDASIDAAIWTETDPNSRISEAAGTLQLANPHTTTRAIFTDKLQSISALTSGIATLRAEITWTTDTTEESQGGVFIYADNNNYAYIGARGLGGKFRVIVYQGGVSRYSLESAIAKNKPVKITYDISTSEIKFWYYDAGSWTQIGVTQTQNIGSTVYAVLTSSDAAGFTGANPVLIDDLCFWSALSVEPAWGSWGVEEDLTVLTDQAGLSDDINAFSLTDQVEDAFGLGDSVDGYSLTDQIQDGLGAGDAVDAYREVDRGLSDELGLGDAISATGEILATVSDIFGLGDEFDGLNWTAWVRENMVRAVPRYYFKITGAPDGLTDLTLPMASFQARRGDDRQTYLTVVIPRISDSGDIADRANGELVIDMAYDIDGVEVYRQELVRTGFDDIQISQGAESRAIQLSGYAAISTTAKTEVMEQPTFFTSANGLRRYRFARVEPHLNPGDTLNVNDDSLRVGSVYYYISPAYSWMEVGETAVV